MKETGVTSTAHIGTHTTTPGPRSLIQITRRSSESNKNVTRMKDKSSRETHSDRVKTVRFRRSTFRTRNCGPSTLPGPDAPWHPTIAEFALTYNGYEAMGNRLYRYAERRFEKWQKDGSLPRDLLHLRSCLFMEQRAVRWAEERPFPTRAHPRTDRLRTGPYRSDSSCCKEASGRGRARQTRRVRRPSRAQRSDSTSALIQGACG